MFIYDFKGMKITNQLLYQLSYKGTQRCINKNPYFAIKIIDCSQLLLKLLAFDAICRSKVTNKSPIVLRILYVQISKLTFYDKPNKGTTCPKNRKSKFTKQECDRIKEPEHIFLMILQL